MPKHRTLVSVVFLCLLWGCVKLDKPNVIAECDRTGDCNNVDSKVTNSDSRVSDVPTGEPDLSLPSPDGLVIPDSNTSDGPGATKDASLDTISDGPPRDNAPPIDTRDTGIDVTLKPSDAVDGTSDSARDTSPDIIVGPCSQGGLPAPAGTVCRASTDLNSCDPIEHCSGTSLECPLDTKYVRPAAPTGVQATSADPTTISWTISSGATGYNVKRSNVSGSGYTTQASISSPPYADTRMTGGVTYYYVITATNTIPSCMSTESNEVSVSFSPNDQSLVGFWHFDETRSPYADASGNGHNGAGVNAPTSGEGKIGAHSVKLNGTTQAVCLAKTMPPPTAQFSEVAWIKVTNAMNSTRQMILGYYDDGSGLRFFVSSGSLSFEKNNLGASGKFPTDPSGIWTHVAGTFDGNSWKVYVNGNQVGTENRTISAFESGRPWCIGRKASAESAFFGGEIDEVRIYNRALTATEVANLHKLDHL